VTNSTRTVVKQSVRLRDFLSNKGAENPLVASPAFSLTKWLQTGALVLTPLVTVLVAAIPKVDFTTWQIVALTAALLAFLATTASADVLARGVAAGAEKLAAGTTGKVVAIDPPVRGFLSADTRTAVTVVAARPQGPDFLVVRADALEWVAQAAVSFDAEATAHTLVDPVT
jgi:hypothetical protein